MNVGFSAQKQVRVLRPIITNEPLKALVTQYENELKSKTCTPERRAELERVLITYRLQLSGNTTFKRG